MTRISEDNPQSADLDRGYEDDDDLLSLDSDPPYVEGVALADVGYGDEIDGFDEVDTIADELSWMGFHSANDLG